MKTEFEIKKQLVDLLNSNEFDYQQFLELTTDIIDHDSSNLRFRTDAGTIAHLGKESIKDHTTAILELVKNGYDADATRVEIEIHIDNNESTKSFIRIADNGIGMTKDEVIKNWLRIGFSTKRNEKISKKNRRKTGEKGIGRLSADRLGAEINLTTKSAESEIFGLKINWDDFNKQGVDLLLIPFKKIDEPTINIPISENSDNKTGTQLIITNLRNSWGNSDLQRLYDELSILTSPFRTVKDFQILVSSNIPSEFTGEIKPKEHLNPEVEINVYYDGVGSEIKYIIKDKYGFSDQSEKSIQWNQLSQKTKDKGYLRDVKDFDITEDKPQCGPVIFDLMFYPRESALLRGTGFTLNQLKEYLSYNGGVKIYRDNISVKPYGFSGKDGEDWLNLGERQGQNPAGIGREDWMVKNNQVLGAVYISRDENVNLMDSAAREGLVHNEGYFDLRALVLCGMRLLELHRHKINQNQNPPENNANKKSSKKILEEYKAQLDLMKTELDELRNEAQRNNHTYVLNASNRVQSIIEYTDETSKSITEILDKNRTLGGLATIGIASAVFGHETQMSISQFKTAADEALESLNETPADINEAIKELLSAKDYAKNVSEWGTFALTRIKRDKRQRKETNVKSLLEKTIKEINSTFQARGIQIKTSLEEVSAKTFPMDIETILINLLTNSYSACLHNKISREIHLQLKNSDNEREGFEIIISDSGNGIPEDFREIIWEALYTTKMDEKRNDSGTGLGLTIVQSIIDDMDGSRKVENDEDLKGAKFTIWLPKK